MLTEAERVKLYELVYAFRDGRGGLTGIEQHVESLCAQARADALEEAAKVCDARAEWLHSNMHALKAEQSETLAEAIRARKDGQ